MGQTIPQRNQILGRSVSDAIGFLQISPAYPGAIYTSNPIERMNKEFRKRPHPMNSLTNIEAAEKIVYMIANDYNDKWSTRIICGFGDPDTKESLNKLYEARYVTKSSQPNAETMQEEDNHEKLKM